MHKKQLQIRNEMHSKSVNVQLLKQTREWHGMRIKLCYSNNVVFETLTSSQMMTEDAMNTTETHTAMQE